MGRIPAFGDALKMMQTQTEIMADLPATIAELHRAVKTLAELLTQTKETVASAQRVSERLEVTLNEIEGPIRALRPGLERLVVTLDDPVIDRIPDSLKAIEATVLPINDGVQRIRGLTRRVADRMPGRRRKVSVRP